MRFVQRYGIIAILLAIFISSLAVGANAETQSKASVTAAKADIQVSFAPSTRVMLFSSSDGQWALGTFAQTKPGNEFYFNNQVYRVVDSDKAQVVLRVDAGKLFEADRRFDKTSLRPVAGDVVQVLDKDIGFTAHAVLGTVQPGALICFQGRAYNVKTDRSLTNEGRVFSSGARTLQRIEITKSGLQHVMDRHSVSGTKNAGASIFYPEESIHVLIKNAELTIPVVESNGYLKRVFDAGRNIGYDGQRGKSTSTYRVITTQTGKLVTAYPVLQ